MDRFMSRTTEVRICAVKLNARMENEFNKQEWRMSTLSSNESVKCGNCDPGSKTGTPTRMRFKSTCTIYEQPLHLNLSAISFVV